jgi:hypothetical protein
MSPYQLRLIAEIVIGGSCLYLAGFLTCLMLRPVPAEEDPPSDWEPRMLATIYLQLSQVLTLLAPNERR